MKTPLIHYTPSAPWSIDINGLNDDIAITGHEDVVIARIEHQDTQCDGGRSLVTERGIAHLIAAAPELLHHLRILAAEDSQCASDWVKMKEAARTVIASAEGRS